MCSTDDEVGAVATVQAGSVVFQSQVNLADVGERGFVQLVAKAVFVGALEQAGTEAGVYSHRQPNDVVGEAVFHASQGRSTRLIAD